VSIVTLFINTFTKSKWNKIRTTTCNSTLLITPEHSLDFRLQHTTPNFPQFTAQDKVVILIAHESVRPFVSKLFEHYQPLDEYIGVAYTVLSDDDKNGALQSHYTTVQQCWIDIEYYPTLNVSIGQLYLATLHLSVNDLSLEAANRVFSRMSQRAMRTRFTVESSDKWCNFMFKANNMEDELFSSYRSLLDVDVCDFEAIDFTDGFPDECFINIIMYCDVNDWKSFSFANKKCFEFANRVIWKRLYYQMTGTNEKPHDKSYYQMCASFISPTKLSVPLWTKPIMFSIIEHTAECRNAAIKKLLERFIYRMEDQSYKPFSMRDIII
jgi:hypothetical protein